MEEKFLLKKLSMENETEKQEASTSANEDTTSQNTETTEETTESTEGATEETVEEVKARLAKSEELYKNTKIRAEKAEKLNKKPVEKVEKKESGLSQSDLYALMRNNVPEEDVGEVADYAKLKGLTVAEALKTGFVQARLKTLGEERVTAKATSTGKSPRGSGNVSGDSILEKARNNGELPESDDDMRKLVEARLGIKK